MPGRLTSPRESPPGPRAIPLAAWRSDDAGSPLHRVGPPRPAALLALAGLLCLIGGIRALGRGGPPRFSLDALLGRLLLACGPLLLTLGVSVQGYRALTRESVAAVVTVQPTAPQRFDALLRLPDGREERFARGRTSP